MIKIGDKLLARAGYLGGQSIFHPFRLEKEYNKKPETDKFKQGFNYQTLDAYIVKQNMMKARVSPHLHNVGYCMDKNGEYGRLNGAEAAKIYHETGWIIKMIHPDERAGIVFRGRTFLWSPLGYFQGF